MSRIKLKLYFISAWPVLLSLGIGFFNVPLLIIGFVSLTWFFYQKWEWAGTSSLPFLVESVDFVDKHVMTFTPFMLYRVRLSGKKEYVFLVSRDYIATADLVRLIKIDDQVYYAKLHQGLFVHKPLQKSQDSSQDL